MVVALSDSDWAGDITRRINQRVGHEVCIAYSPGGRDENRSTTHEPNGNLAEFVKNVLMFRGFKLKVTQLRVDNIRQ